MALVGFLRYDNQDSNFFYDYLALLGTMQPAPRESMRERVRDGCVEESALLQPEADRKDARLDQGGAWTRTPVGAVGARRRSPQSRYALEVVDGSGMLGESTDSKNLED